MINNSDDTKDNSIYDYSLYKDKYYVLVNNINLGNLIFDPIGNKDNYFIGQRQYLISRKFDFLYENNYY